MNADEKLLEAMSWGREYMLAKFANLPVPGRAGPGFTEYMSPRDGDSEIAEKALNEFRKQFGELFPENEPDAFHGWYVYVLNFRYHWRWMTAGASATRRRAISVTVKMQAGGEEKRQVDVDGPSAWSTNILNVHATTIEVDFTSGRITLRPVTLLGWLVVSMMESRRNLAICACEGCETPYFVKIHPRMRYCSANCSSRARQRGQWEWERANRSKDKRGVAKRKPTNHRNTPVSGRNSKGRPSVLTH